MHFNILLHFPNNIEVFKYVANNFVAQKVGTYWISNRNIQDLNLFHFIISIELEKKKKKFLNSSLTFKFIK